MSTPSEIKFNIYFSNPASMQVISSRGKPMMFVSGRYHTKDPGEIQDLDLLCENGSGAVFKDPNMLQLSGDQLDPMNVLKARHIKEYLDQQAAMLNPNNDGGTSVQGPLNAASTTSIAPVAAGGVSTIGAMVAAASAKNK